MFVSMWMTRDVLTVTPTAPLAEIATVMMRRRIRRLPVVSAPGERGTLLGIVTHSDVLHAFPPDINPFAINAAESMAAIEAAANRVRLTAGDLMAREPRTTTPDAPLESAARQMRDHKIGALPVVSKLRAGRPHHRVRRIPRHGGSVRNAATAPCASRFH